MRTIWIRSGIVLAVLLGASLVFMTRKRTREEVPATALISELKPSSSKSDHQTRTNSALFRSSQKELTESEKAELQITFEERLRPALQEWCNAYDGRVPFDPEALSVDHFLHSTGRGKFCMYMFVFDGITLGIAEVNGSAHVSYMNTPQAKKLMALPDAPPTTDLSATRNEITKMLTADSGIDFPPAEIRIIPTAFSSAMNGGVHVNVGGDPNNVASWKYTLVFGTDGNLNYYCKGY